MPLPDREKKPGIRGIRMAQGRSYRMGIFPNSFIGLEYAYKTQYECRKARICHLSGAFCIY